MPKTKVTLNLSEPMKQRLESLKTRLRREGVARSDATESAIVESLIRNASIAALLKDIPPA